MKIDKIIVKILKMVAKIKLRKEVFNINIEWSINPVQFGHIDENSIIYFKKISLNLLSHLKSI